MAAFFAVALIAPLGFTMISGDGSETLGPPSIAVSTGNDVITIPAGAFVEQVLLYWEGQSLDTADDTISIDGNSVTGALNA